MKVNVNIKSSVFPLNVNIYNSCGNSIYFATIWDNLNTCISTNCKEIVVEINYSNNLQLKKINLLKQRCFCWFFEPQNVEENLNVQTFSLTDANYGFPIAKARLNFELAN